MIVAFSGFGKADLLYPLHLNCLLELYKRSCLSAEYPRFAFVEDAMAN